MDLKDLSKKLASRGFIPVVCDNAKQAADKILELIPADDTVGAGGSVTISQLNIPELLTARGTTLYSHSTVPEELKNKVYQLAASAKWYLASANAITENGEIINTDGSANRVSALIFGVPNIIYAVGKNKIVKDFDAAVDRIRNYTCHLNAVRLGKSTPCAITGKCAYCTGKECMCNVTTIVHHPTRYQEKVYILLINEELGY